jgi:chromosomal replication initiation ATPase DnaA
MYTIGNAIEAVLSELKGKTGLHWSAQLTSKGFIVYRKPRIDEYVVSEYNKWRDACCTVFNVEYNDLDNDDKSNSFVAPRHWCWYMMTSVSMLNVDSIVKMLNNQKNRTSVLHAIRKIHFYIHRKNPDKKSLETFNQLLNHYQNSN